MSVWRRGCGARLLLAALLLGCVAGCKVRPFAKAQGAAVEIDSAERAGRDGEPARPPDSRKELDELLSIQ